MTTFKINKNAKIICQRKDTRNGFKHTAKLIIDGIERDNTKISYLNRTWERYDFESVIEKLLSKTTFLTDRQKKTFLSKAEGKAQEEIDKQFKTIGAIAKMGEIFHADDKKAQNDWKAKMLKAGLKNKGLIMPEDWEELSEDTKQARLDAVIEHLAD